MMMLSLPTSGGEVKRSPGVSIFRIKKDGGSGERDRPAGKGNWQRVIRQGSTLLAEDFSAHSQRWNPRWQVQCDTTFCEGVIDENGLEIVNDGRPTHHLIR